MLLDICSNIFFNLVIIFLFIRKSLSSDRVADSHGLCERNERTGGIDDKETGCVSSYRVRAMGVPSIRFILFVAATNIVRVRRCML